ncbi:DUF1376 domain-containing protein [Azospirillum sp. YIM B02556]|uniref:DUF1376 domain-containing protein n=1 Tax=Azospirillum endophyticum TaxID=2800326 RepID=A0ABS1FGH6_9PROT|nr:DUF1376 domain-containing protein [Azospirillum endophyticum]MBK1842433.1 DUF1376 domain-containing protein [Azospirillum endophyticum]
MEKARRVDYWPDEVIAGVAGQLDPEEFGVYWMVCTLIYSRGGKIKDDPEWIARIFRKTSARTIRAVLNRLENSAKLVRVDGELVVNRCQTELERTLNRTRTWRENGTFGGRPSKENNNIGKPNGFSDKEATENRAFNYQPATSNQQQEEGQDPPGQPSRYAFEGRVIRLNQKDLDGWRAAFHAIPDLPAELTSIDGWLSDQPAGKRRNWFNAVSGMLNRKHQELLQKRPAGAKPLPQLSDALKRGVY